MTRDIAGASSPPLLPSSPAPVTVNKPADRPDSNGSVPTPSLAITKPVSSSGGIQTLLDKAADEGLVILESPKVREPIFSCFYGYTFLVLWDKVAKTANGSGRIFQEISNHKGEACTTIM